MLYWYRDLMVSDKFKKKTTRHIHRVERYYRALPKSRIFSDKKRAWEHLVGKKIPWKEYFVVTRATNPANLFDVMGTRQWVLRHYARTDLYVIGLYASEDEALKALEEMLSQGYQEDPSYRPREAFDRDEDYTTYTDREVGAVKDEKE